jgi:hypothetical protein
VPTARRAGVTATVVLTAGAVLLGTAAVWQLGRLVGASGTVGAAATLSVTGDTGPPRRSGQPPLEQYNRVFERGHFGKESKPEKPRLVGVLGSQAFLGHGGNEVQAYTVGAELPGGFVLAEVQADAVVIEREGETERLTVFPRMEDRSYRPPPRPRGRPERAARTPPESRAPAREPEAPEHGEVVTMPSSVGPGGVPADALRHMPPEVRAQIERQMRELQVGGRQPASPRVGDEQ